MKSSSPGWDGTKMELLKEVKDFLSVPLSHLINLSMEQGIVPDELKLARVVPIFKSGDKTQTLNYRPISVLPSLSKLFERVIHNRISKFLEKYKILYAYQFGFRKDHSTCLATSYLVDKITKALDDKEYFLSVFLDLSKAFDTVNHNILLIKLAHYGIRGSALNWFKSYLSNRKQFVEINASKSNTQNIACGVPQGSILGPLLFFIYINDLPNASNILKTLNFADDTTLFFKDKCINNLQITMNQELKKIVQWLTANQLSLNIKKTCAMLFSTKSSVTNSLNICINNEIVPFVDQFKFLGVVFDKGLHWKLHIDVISCKIAKSTGIINKVKHKLNYSTLITFYYLFVYPYLNYCNTIWGNAALKHVNGLHLLQKRIVRLIFNAGFHDHTKELFVTAKIVNIFDLYKFNVLLLMFKHFKNLLPPIFDEIFLFQPEQSRYPKRQKSVYQVVFCRTELRKKTIVYTGPSYFNNFVTNSFVDLTIIYTVSSFRKCVLSSLFSDLS